MIENPSDKSDKIYDTYSPKAVLWHNNRDGFCFLDLHTLALDCCDSGQQVTRPADQHATLTVLLMWFFLPAEDFTRGRM